MASGSPTRLILWSCSSSARSQWRLIEPIVADQHHGLPVLPHPRDHVAALVAKALVADGQISSISSTSAST